MASVMSPVNSMSVAYQAPWAEVMSVWNTVVVDKAKSVIHKPMDDTFGRCTAYRKGKSISRVSIYFSKNKAPLLSRWKWSNVINLHQVGSWSPQGMMLYGGLSVGLRWPWRVGQRCWAHEWILSLPPEPFFIGPLTSGWVKRLTSSHRMGPPMDLLKSPWSPTLWWSFTWDTNIFKSSVHSERSIHTPLPQPLGQLIF